MLSIQGIHFGFKCKLLSRFTYRLNGSRSNHRFGFGLNDCLLLRNGSSRIQSSSESCNLGHSRSHIAGFGNALLLCFDNGLLLFFNNSLLLCRRISTEMLSIQGIHFGFKCKLLSRFTYRLNGFRSNHRFGFGLDNCLLLRYGVSGIQSSGESCNLSHSGSHITGLGNTFFLCLDNSLFFLFDYYLLLCGSFGGAEFCIKGIHFSLKCKLFSRFTYRLNGFRSNHRFGLGLNDCLLLRNGSSRIQSSSESCNLGHSRSHIAGFGNAFFLCLDNGLLLLLNNGSLFCRSFSSAEFCVEGIHFGFKCKLLSRFTCGLNILGSSHSFAFRLNDRLLLRS